MASVTDTELTGFVADAFLNAPGIRRWLESARLTPADIRSVADLDRVPVLSKDTMVQLQAADPPFGGFLGVPIEQVARIFISPGPLYEAHGRNDDWRQSGAILLRQAGFGADSVVLNALGYHLAPGGFLLDGILTSIGATIVPVGVGNAELQVKMMTDLNACCYAGTPSWLLTLLKRADELGLPKSAIPLRRALLSAEPLAGADRQWLVEEYGLTILNAYATAELGLLAFDLEGDPALRLVETPIIQVVDPDTGQGVAPGEVGEVVVTNLNGVYPLIRFGTGDLAINIDPAPGSSSQGERRIRLVGRIGDAVKVRGMFVHPNQVRVVLGRFGVTTFALIVDRPDTRDHLTLQISAPAGNALAAEDIDAIRTAFQQICRVHLDEIEVLAAGIGEAGEIIDRRSWD